MWQGGEDLDPFLKMPFANPHIAEGYVVRLADKAEGHPRTKTDGPFREQTSSLVQALQQRGYSEVEMYRLSS